MIWSDRKILENANIISPFNTANVQPNSYDVTLGEEILVDTPGGWVKHSLPYSVNKSEFVLATTKETVNIPNCVVSTIVGKSSVARRGLAIEDAGYIDSGFCGQITLEITNHSERAFHLTPGMKIGQLVFFDSEYSDNLYGSCGNHYQHQIGATPAYSDSSETVDSTDIARDIPQQCITNNNGDYLESKINHDVFVKYIDRVKNRIMMLHDLLTDLLYYDNQLNNSELSDVARLELLMKLTRYSEDIIRQITPCESQLKEAHECMIRQWQEYLRVQCEHFNREMQK